MWSLCYCRYGFDSERCRTVLRSCNGNIGASLEHLLLQCFAERYGEKMQISATAAQTSREECLEQRQEEAFALRSIYGEKFVERIQNRVWTFSLELEYLTNRLSKSKQKGGCARDTATQTSKEICKFYLQGGCKFGSKCRFRHEFPPNHPLRSAKNSVDDSHLRSNRDGPIYELEVRFPEENKYPLQAPLVAFYTTDENLPLACRLHIAEFLFGKALIAAESNEPVVYALVTSLEDESEIGELLENTHHKYSAPPASHPAARPVKLHPEPAAGSNQISEGTPRFHLGFLGLKRKRRQGAQLWHLFQIYFWRWRSCGEPDPYSACASGSRLVKLQGKGFLLATSELKECTANVFSLVVWTRCVPTVDKMPWRDVVWAHLKLTWCVFRRMFGRWWGRLLVSYCTSATHQHGNTFIGGKKNYLPFLTTNFVKLDFVHSVTDKSRMVLYVPFFINSFASSCS